MGFSNTDKYIDGYVTVRVEGLQIEKFINMASKNGITMWELRRIDYTTIEMKMYYYQYPLLKNILRKTNCRSRIISKTGLHFLVNKIKRRAFFAAGAIVFAALIIYLSSFIWFLEVTGNENIDSRKIFSYAEGAGLKTGIHKNSINLRNVEEYLITGIDEISVVNIKYKGTKAIINVVERTMPPEIINPNEAVDIVASKDGIIDTVLVYRGQVMVKKGDFVRAGQVLISTAASDGSYNRVHAMGLITAKTWYESIQQVPLSYSEDVRTGEMKKRISIKWGSKSIYLKNSNISYEKYDKIEKITDIKIFGISTMASRTAEYYYEKETVVTELTYEEAFELAMEKAEEEINKSMPLNTDLIDKQVERDHQEDGVRVRVLYTVMEDIGMEKKIDE
jgi:similar to stage IV sporulation protein